jgi:hypothetical protein
MKILLPGDQSKTAKLSAKTPKNVIWVSGNVENIKVSLATTSN